MLDPTVTDVMELICDLYDRSGVDYAIDACIEHMDEEDVELLDYILERSWVDA